MIPYSHLLNLTDDTGLYQHAKGRIPWREHGYCSDDVCRALLFAVRETHGPEELRRAANTYVSFLMDAANPPHGFRNFMSFDRRWLEEVGSPDCQGRVAWALAETAANDPYGHLAFVARDTLERIVPHLDLVESPRAIAFYLMALRHGYDETARNCGVARLTNLFQTHSRPEWTWFEPYVTYCNAILPHALIVQPEEESQALGLKTLEWLFEHERDTDIMAPTGNQGFAKPGYKAKYGQQPVELQELSMACVSAFKLTAEMKWKARQHMCLAWFDGYNTRGVQMADPSTGAGFDGLEEESTSFNAGAESTLAYLFVRQDAEQLAREA
ncbi:hypothetical protein EON79_07975 [bacterium]|nr:MAG: hypothetical protein EON79_07975 [bacterium]